MANKTRYLVLAMFFVMTLAYQANADILITPAGPGLVATGNETSNAEVVAAIQAICAPEGCPELYKMNVGDVADTGPYAPFYETTYIPAVDPGDALIEWVGPQYITEPAYLLVKDGHQIPAWYLFDVSGWNGQDTISLSGFWPRQGAISHVAIYGGGGSEVPEPGSLLLLGTGIVGLAVLRRRLRLSSVPPFQG